jgi:hypothetical protein
MFVAPQSEQVYSSTIGSPTGNKPSNGLREPLIAIRTSRIVAVITSNGTRAHVGNSRFHALLGGFMLCQNHFCAIPPERESTLRKFIRDFLVGVRSGALIVHKPHDVIFAVAVFG